MAHPHRPASSRLVALEFVCLAMLLGGLAGCYGRHSVAAAARVFESVTSGLDTDLLRIATTWPEAEQELLEKEFRAQTTGPVPVRLVWIQLAPGTRLDTVADRALPADVLLGGPLTEYIRLSRAGRLEPLDGVDAPDWYVSRRRQIAMNEPPGPTSEAVSLDDPRVDPPTLTWAAEQLRIGSWQDGYARLVLLFSRWFHRPGWQSGPALTAANRSEAVQTLRVADMPAVGGDTKLNPSLVTLNEGAAILRGGWHATQARAFLRFLHDHHGAEAGSENEVLDPDLSDLLADLLGATLVDAQEELLIAAGAVERAAEPVATQARVWLVEPPPWPPASVEKLQSRGGESALAMIQDLASQVAPEPESRFWVMQSWLRPSRVIDGGAAKRAIASRRWAAGARASVSCLAARGMDSMGPATVSSCGPRRNWRRSGRCDAAVIVSASRPILNQLEGQPLNDSRHRRRAGQAVRAGRCRGRRIAGDRPR